MSYGQCDDMDSNKTVVNNLLWIATPIQSNISNIRLLEEGKTQQGWTLRRRQ